MLMKIVDSHLSKLKLLQFPCFALSTTCCGKREQKFPIDEGSLGIIWNWQLEQQAALNLELWQLLRLLKFKELKFLRGALQMGQNNSEEIDSFVFRLYLFWRLRIAKGTLQLSVSGILLNSNGVSFPAVRKIVHSREEFSS
jgi:hypothetical protein